MGGDIYVKASVCEIFKLHFAINFNISNIIILVKIITVTSWLTNPHATRAFGTLGWWPVSGTWRLQSIENNNPTCKLQRTNLMLGG
jgi:hypothetical protein